MSLTIETLLKSQGEVHLVDVEIQWFLTSQSDEDETIELLGVHNIDSYYDSHTVEIQKPRTHITGFFEIFNKLQFTDTNTHSSFIISVNHITEYELGETTLTIAFTFHRSLPQFAFNFQQPLIAGIAKIYSSNENLMMLESLIHKNLHLHYGDHVFKIPRCNRCSSALTLHNQVDGGEEVINEDFVCMDCYTVINNFYNILENEVYKISDPEQIKEQRNTLVKFIIAGKKNASQIEEIQLQHFYNLLIIYIEYYCGNLPSNETLQKINAVIRIGETQNFPALKSEAEQLLNKLNLAFQESHVVLDHAELEPEANSFNLPPISSESEPDPPPVPLGTPSPSTVIPQDQSLSEGLQSLDSVQAELRSTLEALSLIESDLNPRPISPIDKIHALNTDLDIPDKITTFEDIQESFSDLESLDFPDIRFGVEVDETAEEPFEEQEMNLEDTKEKNPSLDQFTSPSDEQASLSSPSFVNPPSSITTDQSDIYANEDTYEIPTVKDLPPSSESFIESVVSLNPPPSPPILPSPTWRTVSDTTNLPSAVNTPPRMNPPPVVNPPPQINVLRPVIPPPRLNLPNSPSNISHLEQNMEQNEPELPEQHYEQPSEQVGKSKTTPPSTFFNSFNNDPRKFLQNNKKTNELTPSQISKPPEIKTERIKRDRSDIHRRIICSFCGFTISRNDKQCPNCGSTIKK